MRIKIYDRKKKADGKRDERASEILKNSKLILKTNNDKLMDNVAGVDITYGAENAKFKNFVLNKVAENTFVFKYDPTSEPVEKPKVDDILDIGIILYNLDEIYIENPKFGQYVTYSFVALFFSFAIFFMVGLLIGRVR